MAVKGSGGDLRSITDDAASPSSTWTSSKQLIARYRGEAHEDEMVGFYPLCAFGENRVAASIDTPLHAFLPFPHVDHLHPDWAIALAASANGERKLRGVQREVRAQDRLGAVAAAWVRAGPDAAKRAVEATPGCDGIILGGHGLFTWGETQHECYLNSITHHRSDGRVHPGARAARRPAALRRRGGHPVGPIGSRSSPRFFRSCAAPSRRTGASSRHYDGSDDALTFANSQWAKTLCRMGTSCPDHFLRTRISPMFVPWDPAKEDRAAQQARSPSAS